MADAKTSNEFLHRDYRVLRTTDLSIFGVTKDVQGHKVTAPVTDKFGFSVEHAWVVRDAFDENPIPPPFTWFYTPADAIAAIEIMDACKASHSPWPSFTAGFTATMRMRNEFWRVMAALYGIRQLCSEDDPFGEMPEKVKQTIDTLFNDMGVKR